jgi:hypothetical protein
MIFELNGLTCVHIQGTKTGRGLENPFRVRMTG